VGAHRKSSSNRWRALAQRAHTAVMEARASSAALKNACCRSGDEGQALLWKIFDARLVEDVIIAIEE